MVELRDYQIEAVDAVINNKVGLVEAATGSGKTTIMSQAILRQEGNVLVLVHTVSLVEQTKRRLADETGYRVSAFYGQEKENLNAPVVVSTWQSMKNILHIVSPVGFKHIHVDEAHNVRSGEYRSVIKHFNPETLHGYTATLDGSGKDVIISVFDKVIYSIGMFDLIERGYLSKIQILVSTSDTPNVKNQRNYNEKKFELIRKMTDENADTTKTLHFYNLNRRFRQIEKWNLLKHGSFQFIEGRTPKKNREQYLDDFRREDSGLNHLIANRVLNEGIDLPITNSLVFHESVGDIRTITQRFGRGLRIWEGSKNQKTLIMFFVDSNDKRHMNQIKNFVYGLQIEAKKKNQDIIIRTNIKNMKKASEPDEEMPVKISFVDVTDEVFWNLSNNREHVSKEKHIMYAINNCLTNAEAWCMHFEGNYFVNEEKYASVPANTFNIDFFAEVRERMKATYQEHIEYAVKHRLTGLKWKKHFNGNYYVGTKKYCSDPRRLNNNFFALVSKRLQANFEEHLQVALNNHITNGKQWTQYFNKDWWIDNKRYWSNPRRLRDDFFDIVRESISTERKAS